MNINQVTIGGRLGADPVIRQIMVGERVVKMATFSIAANRRKIQKGNAPGEPSKKIEQAEWHRVVAWGKQAEFCSQYLKKGRFILVEGQLRVSVVTSDETDKPPVRFVEIEAARFHFAPGNKKRGETSGDLKLSRNEAAQEELDQELYPSESDHSGLLTQEEEILA